MGSRLFKSKVLINILSDRHVKLPARRAKGIIKQKAESKNRKGKGMVKNKVITMKSK